MNMIIGLIVLFIVDLAIIFLAIILALSIVGKQQIEVTEIDRRVKEGEGISIKNVNFWIWLVTKTFGGLGVRRFLLFTDVFVFAVLAIATVSVAWKLAA